MRRSFFLPFVLMAALVSSCAFLKAASRALAVGGGAAVGGAVGGPVGAAAGGGATYLVMENSELRTGSLKGEEAREAEIAELKSLALILQGDLQLKERAANAALAELERTKGYFDGTKKFWTRVIVLGFFTRNLVVLWVLIRCLRKKRWLLAVQWLGHMFHPWRPKDEALDMIHPVRDVEKVLQRLGQE